MLLLLTIALVLVGAVSLVIGFVGGEQLPIFISIACSLLAGVVLVVFSRMSRRQGAPATAGGPAPLPDEAAPATARQAAVSDAEVEDAVSEPEPAARGRAFAADTFPIEDYDELLVSEILPLLAELDADELDQVRDREESGKARATLLRRIEQLAEGEDEDEPTVATPAFAARSAAVDDDGDEGDDDLMFPIEDYDDLRVSEILPLLPELYDDELELVADRERDGANRASVLNRIEELLGGAEPAPAPKKAAPKKAAPKKAAAKKTPAKRAPAPAKRAPAPAKRAAPAKKAVAKKAASTARKAPAATRTVKKAAAKKTTTAKKTAAKKTTARKR